MDYTHVFPPATPTQSAQFLEDMIQTMIDTWSAIETVLSSIQIGPLTLWQWILASFAMVVILTAVKLLTGDVSLSFTSLFHRSEEGRFHRREVYTTERAKHVPGDAHRVRWNDVQHNANL